MRELRHVSRLCAPRASLRAGREPAREGAALNMFYADVKQRAPVAEYDQSLVWVIVLLLGLGLVMVYSASVAIAEGSRATGHHPMYFLLRHAIFVTVSILLAVVAFQIPMQWWQRSALYSFLLGV